MTDYRLEGRYLVIKISDLDPTEKKLLEAFMEEWKTPTRNSVVIEEDWPEYTPVCDMLFGRIDREASANRRGHQPV